MQEIRVRDGDLEQAVAVESRPMWAHWVDAHRFREMGGTPESRRLEVIDWMRGVARDDYIPRRGWKSTALFALVLLADTLDDVALASTSATLAKPGAILHIQLTEQGGSHIRVGFAEEAGARKQ